MRVRLIAVPRVDGAEWTCGDCGGGPFRVPVVHACQGGKLQTHVTWREGAPPLRQEEAAAPPQVFTRVTEGAVEVVLSRALCRCGHTSQAHKAGLRSCLVVTDRGSGRVCDCDAFDDPLAPEAAVGPGVRGIRVRGEE